jgi:hypothetical protein
MIRASHELQHELQQRFDDIVSVKMKFILSRLINSHTQTEIVFRGCSLSVVL